MNDIYQDCRLISINSNDAFEYKNGDKNSDLIFNFQNIIPPSKDILFANVGVIDAQIPVAWYLIDSDTNILNFKIVNGLVTTTYQLVLQFGNYYVSNFITELQSRFDLLLSSVATNCLVEFDIITGKLFFSFSNLTTSDVITFLYAGSDGLYRILGFQQNVNYSDVQVGVLHNIYCPKPMNLLGIKSIRICSNSLATISSFDSDNRTNNLLACIPIDVPSWSLITYTNKLGYFGRLKTFEFSNIDLQLYDELGRFLQLNGTNFTITIQIVVYRKMMSRISNIDLEPLLDKLDVLDRDIININPNNSQTLDNTIPIDNSVPIDDDLGVLMYP